MQGKYKIKTFLFSTNATSETKELLKENGLYRLLMDLEIRLFHFYLRILLQYSQQKSRAFINAYFFLLHMQMYMYREKNNQNPKNFLAFYIFSHRSSLMY